MLLVQLALWKDKESIFTVYYVGVLLEHQGHKLGYTLFLKVLYKAKERGVKQIYLLTDGFRLPAIKTYLKLGFIPSYVAEDHKVRWKEIFKKIGGKR